MTVRLGAVSYLNAKPLIAGLDSLPRFSLRVDVPSRCADLLHQDAIDVGLIPSIEYLRGARSGLYSIVPGVAIASDGVVASVALYTTRPLSDVRTIALDTSSRTSVALLQVLCHRVFRMTPSFQPAAPSLQEMLATADAALLIGDNALLLDGGEVELRGRPGRVAVEKIDMGLAWTGATGLPFVYAVWVGREGALNGEDVSALQRARDEGTRRSDAIASEHFRDAPEQIPLGKRYLRENIKYALGPREQQGLELFYRYAHEAGAAPLPEALRFFR